MLNRGTSTYTKSRFFKTRLEYSAISFRFRPTQLSLNLISNSTIIQKFNNNDRRSVVGRSSIEIRSVGSVGNRSAVDRWSLGVRSAVDRRSAVSIVDRNWVGRVGRRSVGGRSGQSAVDRRSIGGRSAIGHRSIVDRWSVGRQSSAVDRRLVGWSRCSTRLRAVTGLTVYRAFHIAARAVAPELIFSIVILIIRKICKFVFDFAFTIL